MLEPIIERPEMEILPQWACTAFASRCARRVLPVLRETGLDGLEAVEQVLDKIDDCCRVATELKESVVFKLVDEVDDFQLQYREKTDDNHKAACLVISSAKLAAYCLCEGSGNVRRNAWNAYRNACQAACWGDKEDLDEPITNSRLAYEVTRDDFEQLKRRCAEESLEANTAVDPANAFGTMWSTVTPTWAHGMSRWDRMTADGMKKPESGETNGERKLSSLSALLSSAPKSKAMVVVEQLLDRESGFRCIPRFVREKHLRTVRREPDEFLLRYREEHLELINNHIEPLARNQADGGHPGFHEVCIKLRDAHNLGFVALVLGFDEIEEFDPTVWLPWAAHLESDPVRCLYCAANFIVVPPFAGEMPKTCEGILLSLVAKSLLSLQRPRSAIEIVEMFLGLAPVDYLTIDTMTKALHHSPLGELEADPRGKIIETLIEALSIVPDRGRHRANVVRQANARLVNFEASATRDRVAGYLAIATLFLMLILAIGLVVVGYAFYSRGFDEHTKSVIIGWFVLGVVWWVVASTYKTVREGIK